MTCEGELKLHCLLFLGSLPAFISKVYKQSYLSSTFAHLPYQKITLFPGMVRRQSKMEQVRLSEHIENQVQNSYERACAEDKHKKPARFQ